MVVKVTRSDTKETHSEARMITPMHLTADEQQNLLMQGSRIFEAAAKALEAKADLNPDGIESQLELLGFHFSKSTLFPGFRKAQRDLVFWMIQNYPESVVAGNPQGNIYPAFDPEGYMKAKDL